MHRTGPQTFCASIDQGFDTFWIFRVNHVHKSRVDPPPGFYRVETADHQTELHIVVITLVLNLAVVSV
jgi:hypothetical protein